ncbi:alkaline phosphatase family protein [Pseudonocardia sp. TRM90224]|uniref:alkaline phosphatase family protein n=1 Tax=Pseudonocardia sp. TRM90224 TaxID=2812678 RepID=UPI0027E10355|nr:alkaline phosphatase family protein [Pseudonocardia sp. TRM90224]
MLDEMLVPRYGQAALSDLLPAVLAALGEPGHSMGLPPVRAAAVLLIDGLGHELLRQYAADAPFLAGLPDSGPLTVGFPSTTPISLASLGTGMPPGAHGMLGLSFRIGDRLLDTLKWTPLGGSTDLRDELVPEEVQPSATALERAQAAGIEVTVVSKKEFGGSGLTRAVLRGGRYRGTYALGDLAAGVISAVTGPGRRLCYGYHADLDGLGHLHGPGTLPWRMQLAQVDRLASLIAEHLPTDTVLVITGDHGMVSADLTFDVDTHDDLQRDVLLVGGDPRARHVYTRDGAVDEVLATWRAVLGENAWVVSGEEAVANGWFGPVAVPMRSRIGDVVVAARGGTKIIRPGAEPFISWMNGQHGSLTSAEQLVPLLVVHGG